MVAAHVATAQYLFDHHWCRSQKRLISIGVREGTNLLSRSLSGCNTAAAPLTCLNPSRGLPLIPSTVPLTSLKPSRSSPFIPSVLLTCFKPSRGLPLHPFCPADVLKAVAGPSTLSRPFVLLTCLKPSRGLPLHPLHCPADVLNAVARRLPSCALFC